MTADARRIIIEALRYRYDNFEHYELDEISVDEVKALQIVEGLESGQLTIFQNFTSNSNDLVEVILPVK